MLNIDETRRVGRELVNYGRYYLIHNSRKVRLAETGSKIYQKVRLS
jgi:hypothetical protein